MPSDDQAPRLSLELNPPLAVIRFTRPAERNKLSADTLTELEAAVARLEAQNDLRRVVFTGSGDAFAAGADISELNRLTPADALRFARRGQTLFGRIAALPQLTIAAINGYCFGGGLDLALSCRLRYAARAATFAHPGATLGIITGWGGTGRLPALVGHARALEMFLTVRRLTSAEAFAWGLVHKVCDDALAEATSELEVRRFSCSTRTPYAP